jgi:hypothetical protein
MSPYADIPVALVADFERDDTGVAAQLAEHCPHPRLFTLFGGTIGNLDLGETRFFDRLHRLIPAGDHLLMDVPLAGPGWTADREPRLQASAYTEPFRRFLAGGLRPAPSAIGIERFVRAFPDRVTFVLQEDRFPGARTITIVDRLAGRPLLRLTRYDWQATIQWLAARGWRVVAARSSLREPADCFGMGVVLVTPAGNGHAI